MRMLKTAVFIGWLGLTSLVSGYDEAWAGVAVSLRPVNWVRHCHCYRHRVRSSRRSWVVRVHHPNFGSCWLLRATHWGIRRVWSCYYLY
jgi:hypothetical protein